ncbi:Band 4.1-like protein 5 [Eumeta japonica]|uniref:Band 4.1-like protein 5 n=1 Tax=Eumeta variegata TaxID=151549 RepID=A0A4C1ZPZ2_EUMVA|nr:Band 4.1-like protein 5 [Eumeta japonica]
MPEQNETSTYGFESPTRAACRHLWRCCSDHHAFFRLQQSSPAAADMFALGSRVRNRVSEEYYNLSEVGEATDFKVEFWA